MGRGHLVRAGLSCLWDQVGRGQGSLLCCDSTESPRRTQEEPGAGWRQGAGHRWGGRWPARLRGGAWPGGHPVPRGPGADCGSHGQRQEELRPPVAAGSVGHIPLYPARGSRVHQGLALGEGQTSASHQPGAWPGRAHVHGSRSRGIGAEGAQNEVPPPWGYRELMESQGRAGGRTGCRRSEALVPTEDSARGGHAAPHTGPRHPPGAGLRAHPACPARAKGPSRARRVAAPCPGAVAPPLAACSVPHGACGPDGTEGWRGQRAKRDRGLEGTEAQGADLLQQTCLCPMPHAWAQPGPLAFTPTLRALARLPRTEGTALHSACHMHGGTEAMCGGGRLHAASVPSAVSPCPPHVGLLLPESPRPGYYRGPGPALGLL